MLKSRVEKRWPRSLNLSVCALVVLTIDATKRLSIAHVSIVNENVVSEFKSIERDQAVHPVLSVGRRVAMYMDS